MCCAVLDSGGLYWALVGHIGLGYAVRGSTALRLRNVHVKLVAMHTQTHVKLLCTDAVVKSKYKQVQRRQEPGRPTAY